MLIIKKIEKYEIKERAKCQNKANLLRGRGSLTYHIIASNQSQSHSNDLKKN